MVYKTAVRQEARPNALIEIFMFLPVNFAVALGVGVLVQQPNPGAKLANICPSGSLPAVPSIGRIIAVRVFDY